MRFAFNRERAKRIRETATQNSPDRETEFGEQAEKR
jgi:hypothetical protein